MSKFWKSSEEIEKKMAEQEREARKQEIKKAREDNLIQDTEVLAEMVMTSMMESMSLIEEVELLKNEIKELKNGGHTK